MRSGACLQFKVHLVALLLVLPLAMVHHLHMVLHLSMPSHSLHMVVTLATPQQQLQHLPTQAMVVDTHSLVVTGDTHRFQLHLMVDSQATVALVLAGMIHMVHLVSKPMEVLGVMVSSLLSQQHSHQAVEVSGRNCRITRAGLTTTIRSQASASGTALQRCEHLQLSNSSRHQSSQRAPLTAATTLCNASHCCDLLLMDLS